MEFLQSTCRVVAAFLCVATLAVAPAASADGEDSMGQPVNVNTADAETLDRVLVGVGPERAQAIVDYRETHGEFSDIADLANVRGVGLATVARNQDRIVAE